MSNYSKTLQPELFERKAIKPYVEEYVRTFPFSQFMGSAGKNIIRVQKLEKGQGSSIQFRCQQMFKPTVAYGTQQLWGLGDKTVYATDSVSVDMFRFSHEFDSFSMDELSVDINLMPGAHASLKYQSMYLNNLRILQQFGLCFTPQAQVIPNVELSYADLRDNIVACLLDDPTGISRQRVVFGFDKGLNAASVGAALDAAVLDNAAEDKLTVNHLRKLKMLAKMGSRTNIANKENPLSPYMLKFLNGAEAPRYVYFGSPEAIFSLMLDPIWTAQATRGVVTDSMQPEFLNGGDFKGMIDGILVYEIEGLGDYTITKNGVSYCYGVLLGADALGYAIYQIPTLVPEAVDYKSKRGIAHEEISGFKALKFPSKTDLAQRGVNPLKVENGIIHSFTIKE